MALIMLLGIHLLMANPCAVTFVKAHRAPGTTCHFSADCLVARPTDDPTLQRASAVERLPENAKHKTSHLFPRRYPAKQHATKYLLELDEFQWIRHCKPFDINSMFTLHIA